MADVKYIYFYYAKTDKRLLYVGQTNNIIGRYKQHKYEDARYKLVKKILFFPLPETYNKEQVDVVESLFIERMKPLWNRTRMKYFTLGMDTAETIFTIFEAVMNENGWKNFIDNTCQELRVEKDGFLWVSKE